MKAVWGILLVLGVLQAVLLLLGVGVGLLLHWVIPDLGIGTGILIGAMCSISSGVLMIMFMHFTPQVQFRTTPETCNVDEDEDDDDDEFENIEIRAVRPRSRAGRRHRSRRR